MDSHALTCTWVLGHVHSTEGTSVALGGYTFHCHHQLGADLLRAPGGLTNVISGRNQSVVKHSIMHRQAPGTQNRSISLANHANQEALPKKEQKQRDIYKFLMLFFFLKLERPPSSLHSARA